MRFRRPRNGAKKMIMQAILVRVHKNDLKPRTHLALNPRNSSFSADLMLMKVVMLVFNDQRMDKTSKVVVPIAPD